MENNIYTAPEAELVDQANSAQASYYVISQTKLWIFSIISIGIFLVPWNYIHWRQIKQNNNSDIWPVPRAIFSIFFVFSLFKLFDEARAARGVEYNWSPNVNAIIYFAISLFSNTSDWVFELFSFEYQWVYWLLTFIALVVPVWTVSNAQRVANMAAGDPTAQTNSKWRLSNYLWVFFVLVLWVSIFFGLISTEF